MKKEIWKTINHGLLMWVVALTVVCAGFYIFIKARTSNSSWLPMDTSNPSTLYVDTNETLTAAKWNKLVDKTNRKEMDINDTTTQFNIECERRRVSWGYKNYAIQAYPTQIMFKTNNAIWRWVKYGNKKQMQRRLDPDRTTLQNISSLQYRCP